MSADVKEIADLNLTYLLLAQKMLRANRAGAMLQLGVSEELAGMIERMTLAQILKLATSNLMLCSMRLAELPIALMQESNSVTDGLRATHMSIVMAGKMGVARAAATA